MATSRKKFHLVVAFAIPAVSIAALIFCAYANGFRYEEKKFKAFVATLTLVFIYQIFVADVIWFFIKAAFNAIRVNSPYTGQINSIFIGSPSNRKFFERRISALKSQLALGPTFYKRNQALTMKYKDILSDLLLYGSYLGVLLILIVGTRDPYLYYNTRTIKDVLRNPKFSSFATITIVTSDDLYDFINGTIVHGFSDGSSYNGKNFAENGWMNLQIAKVLGVVRLRQLRHKDLKVRSHFETAAHGPGWLKGAPSLPFKNKFWRIFKPWEHQEDSKTESVEKSGKLYKMLGGGYVALLGRNELNCQRVLKFLRSNDWIDTYTAVIVIDFTLYNVDADVFTLVVITAEQTAFNSFVVTDEIKSMKLLFNIDNLPWYVLLTFLLYFVILMKVLADVVLKIWYSPSLKFYFSMSWNYVDITIVALNVFIALGVWIREAYVKSLLLQLETSRKNEFVPFNRAASIDETCTVLVAFLVALSTVRLWKILQFARVFRVLTSTLHHAKESLLSTTLFVAVFLVGIGLGSFIINGSNSPSFAEFIKSITTLLTLSFGFGGSVSPSELNKGGSVVGFIFYSMLVIVVMIFLLNMFITVVCLHFSNEREEDSKRSGNKDSYTFWKFIQDEVGENSLLSLYKGQRKHRKTTESSFDKSDRMERLELVSRILDTQMEFFHHNLINRENKSEDLRVLVK